MFNIDSIKKSVIYLLVFSGTFSCVKENKPPDCTKPATPSVTPVITANEGDTVKLHASGIAGATYSWSGPDGFASDIQNPVVINPDFINGGKYWVRVKQGYCYSDSVATEVKIKSDSSCRLAENWADFPNGSSGPFFLSTACATGSGSSYQITSSNNDSSKIFNIIFKQKPSAGGVYTLTDSPNPGNNEVYFKISSNLGGIFYSKGSNAYIKISPGKVSIVVCRALFPSLGVFSANIVCH